MKGGGILRRWKLVRQKLVCTLGLLLSFSVYCSPEGWIPQQSIQIFVPSGKGDATDQLVRILAEELESELNQKIIITNKPGRAGSLATEKVLLAPADGYTWLAGAASDLGTYQLTGKLDTKIQDWHVYLAASQTLVISANPDSKYLTFNDLIADMRSGGDDLTVGTDGYTSSSHMIFEAIRQKVGGAYRLVSHSKGKQAVRSTVSGETLVTTQFISEQKELLGKKRLRPLAVVSADPIEVDGVGVIEPVNKWISNFDVSPVYVGLYMPRGVPYNVINTLNHIWKTRIANSKALSKHVNSNGAETSIAVGPEAQAMVWPSIQHAAWIYYDGGIAKISPDTLGIPRK
jgi:tripartite-type tricarboxylate transporter receptor subunit TctC